MVLEKQVSLMRKIMKFIYIIYIIKLLSLTILKFIYMRPLSLTILKNKLQMNYKSKSEKQNFRRRLSFLKKENCIIQLLLCNKQLQNLVAKTTILFALNSVVRNLSWVLLTVFSPWCSHWEVSLTREVYDSLIHMSGSWCWPFTRPPSPAGKPEGDCDARCMFQCTSTFQISAYINLHQCWFGQSRSQSSFSQVQSQCGREVHKNVHTGCCDSLESLL